MILRANKNDVTEAELNDLIKTLFDGSISRSVGEKGLGLRRQEISNMFKSRSKKYIREKWISNLRDKRLKTYNGLLDLAEEELIKKLNLLKEIKEHEEEIKNA